MEWLTASSRYNPGICLRDKCQDNITLILYKYTLSTSVKTKPINCTIVFYSDNQLSQCSDYATDCTTRYSYPDRGEEFLSSPKSPDRLCGHTLSNSMISAATHSPIQSDLRPHTRQFNQLCGHTLSNSISSAATHSPIQSALRPHTHQFNQLCGHTLTNSISFAATHSPIQSALGFFPGSQAARA